MQTGVMMMITGRAFMGTRPAASFHGRSATEDTTETTVTYATSFAPEMHAAESKANAEIRSVKSKNITIKGTMIIMVVTTTNLIRSSHQKRDASQEVSRHIP
jgi:hypothetical protein